ncbi:hemolysin family protein [Nakamurella sp. A5-74]|uniref:Hemolysin family protein n=1 Tax=Nakamurella sp. A5-74 TaxID=3158264 RepID=A0AAU8DTP5_9ACTN
MTTEWLLLCAVILLLIASAFFVGAEFALVSARRTVVEPLAVHSRRARTTLRAMEDVSLMMATAQFGITLCGVLLGALGEPAVAKLLEPVFNSLGVPEQALHPVALVVALLLVVSAHVALGEMVPKNIALAGPEKTAIMLAPFLMTIARFLGPLIRGLNRFANWVVRITGHEPKDEVASSFTREEVAGLVAESRAEGLIDDEEHQLITSALDFESDTLRSVLLDDAQVVPLPVGASAAEVERTCARTGFSRFPVLDEQGRYAGYVHIRDVVGIPAEQRDEPLPPELIRPLPAFSESTELRAALDRMRRAGAHLAQVAVDPRGTQATRLAGRAIAVPMPDRRRGLVALEDVIEQLIGHIGDATRRRPEIAD